MNHDLVDWVIYTLISLIIGALLWAALFGADPALGYPENVRLGYNGCESCHVSPTGGGVLKAYGRSTAEELSTWASEGSGQLFGAVPLPGWLAIGGDQRHVNINIPDANFHRKFFMQEDVEFAVNPVPYLWVAASVGMYGEAQDRQMRRNYALWSPTENLSLRVGRFLPAYGIMTPDHTVATRSGLGWREGAETYNAELSYRGSLGEVFFTNTFGSDEQVAADSRSGYRIRADKAGATVRGAMYLGQSAQVGASYAYASDKDRDVLTVGPYAIVGVTRNLYLLTEADRQYDWTADTHRDVSFTELGYELFRGFHVQATHEYNAGQVFGFAAQWFPVPHYEILARTKYVNDAWVHTLMLHLYL